MKTKKLFLIAAMLLMSVCSFAQNNNTPLLGDVNGDGKVDVADIVAILKIMKDEGGTAGETTYYWYVGQTDPSTMTSITPIVTDTTHGGGWYELGTTLPTSIETRITGGVSGQVWYEAIPVDANLVAGSSSDPDTSVDRGSIVTIPRTNGIQYQIWINGGATSNRHSVTYNQ